MARDALVLLFLDDVLGARRLLSRLGRRASRWFRGLRRGLGLSGARGDNGSYDLILSISCLSLSYRRVLPGGDRTLAAVFSTKSGFFGLSVRYLPKRWFSSSFSLNELRSAFGAAAAGGLRSILRTGWPPNASSCRRSSRHSRLQEFLEVMLLWFVDLSFSYLSVSSELLFSGAAIFRVATVNCWLIAQCSFRDLVRSTAVARLLPIRCNNLLCFDSFLISGLA